LGTKTRTKQKKKLENFYKKKNPLLLRLLKTMYKKPRLQGTIRETENRKNQSSAANQSLQMQITQFSPQSF
jgi:hypothetical protein